MEYPHATIFELQRYRRRLLDTRFSGVRSVSDSNGEQVTYRSQAEIERAIVAIDSEIAAMQRGRSSIIYPRTSKGL